MRKLLFPVLVIFLVGCSQETDTVEKAPEDYRFEISQTVEEHNRVRVLTDKETGQRYIIYKEGYGASITPLIEEDWQ